MAALIGGAVLGAVAAELLKAVLDAKKKASNFQRLFERLESTLNSIIPRLNEISCLHHQLDIQQHKMDALDVLIKNGIALVLRCSQISVISSIKKVQYWKELSDLDDSLKNYFMTLLPLEHFRNDLNTLKLVKEMHMILVGESESKRREDSDSVYQKKAKTNLFLLKDCRYDIDMENLESCDFEVVSNGICAANYRYSTKYGDFLLKKINLEARVRKIEFEQRIEDIGKVGQHPNVILPFGYFSSELEKFLLYDYVPGRSLAAILKEPVRLGTRADWSSKLKIVLGIAKGITHIHSKGVVHGNIKSSSVLLTSNVNSCISNFGLAPMRNIPETKSRTGWILSAPQLPAPELIRTKEATQESDVYNFGVMLLEIVSTYDMHLLWHCNVLKEQVQIFQIVWKCTNKDPVRRPKMVEVCKLIQKIISQEDLPNPDYKVDTTL